MENKTSQPCQELRELKDSFHRFREETTRRLAAGDVSMATINTKLNWMIGILSSIGVAVLAAVMKLVIA